MRLWLSGPRIRRGLIRPGFSFSGRELSAMGRKAPAIKADAMLGLFRRADGAIFLGMQNANGEHENDPGLIPVDLLSPARMLATAAREGASTRLAKHVGTDGLIAGLSVGQVVSAIRSEAAALGFDARFIRIAAAAAGKARTGCRARPDELSADS